MSLAEPEINIIYKKKNNKKTKQNNIIAKYSASKIDLIDWPVLQMLTKCDLQQVQDKIKGF